MLRKKVPHRSWDYVLKWVAKIMQSTAGSAGPIHYRTLLAEVTGENSDITEYLDSSFYEWCWYNENSGLGETKLVKWLGVYHHVGSLI